MKVSLNWLRDYTKIDLQLDQISDLLTQIGLEVEGLERFESIPGGLNGLIVGEVLSSVKHENADKLSVCMVDVGAEEPLQIVCGAPNVAAGQKVVVAPVNTILRTSSGDSFAIKKAKIRGIESKGMICAEDEIGLGDNHDGIMVLSNDVEVGSNVKDLYDIYSDDVIEIGLTPNRSDAFSHIGVARDLVAGMAIQYDKTNTTNWPSVDEFAAERNEVIDIEVKNAEACPVYAGVVVTDLVIAPSPDWLKNRLLAIGVKPINNVVDITNFVNHELGQPLHAFDLRQLKGKKIIVQNLPDNTKFTTLDDVERKLSHDDLMICNAEEGMCIAGVYGGINSGVKDDTTAIFLESAYFAPSGIRLSELRHDLRTDAAAKYEKGIDPTLQAYAAKRAALLLKELAGGTIASEIHMIEAKKIEPHKITLSYNRLNKLVGEVIPKDKVKEILLLLDFTIHSEDDGQLELESPLYRTDVTREADVVEEVLRIYGFNNVSLSGKANFSFSTGSNPMDDLRNLLSDQLSSQGFFEIMTNSITRSSYYNESDSIVTPLNSLNSHLDIMRPDMLRGGLESMAFNHNRNRHDCLFYEFGRIYHKGKENQYSEHDVLALFVSGNQSGPYWKNAAKETDFQYIKGVVYGILQKAGITKWKESAAKSDQLAFGSHWATKEASIAEFGLVSEDVRKQMDIKRDVYFADLNMNYILKKFLARDQQFSSITKYPAIRRDLALVLDSDVTYEEVKKVAFASQIPTLQSVELFDVFDNEEKLGKGKKSYSVSFLFQNNNKTLTDSEVDVEMKKLVANFEKQNNALIRT